MPALPPALRYVHDQVPKLSGPWVKDLVAEAHSHWPHLKDFWDFKELDPYISERRASLGSNGLIRHRSSTCLSSRPLPGARRESLQ
jgi:hypothetical protein